MTFTAVSGDVPQQPGLKAYNMIASGAIIKGQCVYLVGGTDTDNQVAAPNANLSNANGSGQVLFGVAAYTVANNDVVAIYGGGNLVQAKLSGAQLAGTLVGLYHDGMLNNLVKYPKQAIVTKGVSASGDGEVLLLLDPSGAITI